MSAHTQLDMTFIASVTRYFMHSLTNVHLSYLKGTPSKGILFNRNGSFGVRHTAFITSIKSQLELLVCYDIRSAISTGLVKIIK